MSLATTTILGRLARDFELRYSESGKAFAKASVAVDQGFGEKKTTGWYTLVAFGQTAEKLAEFFKKGSQICASGRQEIRDWEGKDGKKGREVEIIVSEWSFVDKKGGEQDEGPSYDRSYGKDPLPF